MKQQQTNWIVELISTALVGVRWRFGNGTRNVSSKCKVSHKVGMFDYYCSNPSAVYQNLN